MTAPLLIATVVAVGVLHTLVPDHWAPLVVVGRRRRWTVAQTAQAAAIAGCGHVASTLVLGVVLWAVGASLAARYGHLVDVVAALALVGFGVWIAWAGWRELHGAEQHRAEKDERGSRTALLLILGSSPMVEGLPAFFAASTYGARVLGVMAVAFALATIVTYVGVSALALAGLQRVSLGPLERYGEVLSGSFVALVGVYALITA